MTREKTLGILLGLSAGILVDSCLIVLFSLLIVFIAPVLLVPPLITILLGLRSARAGRLPLWSWPKMILAGGTLIILAALLPYLVAVVELRWHGTEIPVPPDSSLIQIRTGPLGSSMAGPSVTHVFETKTDEETLLSFYRRELDRKGWQRFSDLERGAWFIRSGKHMFVRFTEEQGRTLLTVTYNQDRVAGPWLVLLISLAFIVYVWTQNPKRSPW